MHRPRGRRWRRGLATQLHDGPVQELSAALLLLLLLLDAATVEAPPASADVSAGIGALTPPFRLRSGRAEVLPGRACVEFPLPPADGADVGDP